MLGRIDRFWYGVERAAVAGSLGAMALFVTFDVVYRRVVMEYSAGARVGLAVFFYALLLFGARYVRVRAAPLVALVVLAALFGLTRLMLHARSAWTYMALYGVAATAAAARTTPGRRAALGVASLLILWALWKFTPEGFSWAKEISLVLLLYVGFMGASMATHDRRHITVDFIRKLVPERRRNAYECTSHLVSAAFAAFLAWLSLRYVFGEDIGLYRLGGRYDHSGVPTWFGVCAVPLGLSTMTLRLCGHAVAAARGRLKAATQSHG